tara:strand:+ start:252 stop:428 length:177 start_codon:yes stop_codon:yes gene_type:complete
MMKRSGLIVALTVLSACGADAPPMTPTASAGFSVGTSGVSTTAGIGATNGTFSVGLNL